MTHSDPHKRITELLTLSANWDSYGAKQINLRCAPLARFLVNLVTEVNKKQPDGSPGMPLPAILPTPVGGLQLEWHLEHDVEMVIELFPDGGVAMWINDVDGEEWEVSS